MTTHAKSFFLRFGLILLAFTLTLGTPTWSSLRADDAPPAASSGSKSSIKVLMVGNSFSMNSAYYLPALAKASGKTLELLNCVKGGCSLQEHAAGIAAIADNPESPAARIYVQDGSFHPPASVPKNFNLKEALESEKWDYVTIQQYSFLSYKPETFEPYAKQLVDFIRKYAPQAEILVHETWAYREDDPLFKKDGFTQQKMYDALKADYTKLANDYGLRIIPVGDAFQAARATDRWHFVPDPNFDFANPPEGKLPDQGTSLNHGYYLGGGKKLQYDGHHANQAGEYLGGSVLYEVLYGTNVEPVNYSPREIKPEDAASLRKIAHETVEAQKTAKTQTATTLDN